MKHEFKVEKQIKLLEFLTDNISCVRLSALKSLLKSKEIKVNGNKVTQDLILFPNDIISIFIPQKMVIEQGVTIIYEDDNLIVANKPILMDVENHLTAVLKAEGRVFVKPVHRLDRNTTGLVMLAKNDDAHALLCAAIKAHNIKKYYYAVVYGRPKENSGTLKAYLKKDSDKSLCYISEKANDGYLPIETRYKIIQENAPLYTLEVQAVTGRTHQIRAHLSYAGFPIIGDSKYGNNAANREYKYKYQQLKAVRLVLGGLDGALKYLNGKEIFLA